jgi:ELM2 domain
MMKPNESDSCTNKLNNEADQSKENVQEPQPSSSKTVFPNSPDDESATKDSLFEPTVDMMVNDFDEEQTLEEEEALAAKEEQDPGQELFDLQRESEMPIEELLKLYGCGPQAQTSSTSRKRRRRPERTSPKPKEKSSIAQETATTATATTTIAATTTSDEVNSQTEAASKEEESPDEEDAATTTTTMTNILENQSVDETNFEDEEPSELKKLYTGLYDKDTKDGELKLDGTLSDEEDLDYSPDEEENKKTIMVGVDYQAVIPEGLLKYDDALPYENEDKLLWDPSKVNDGEIEDYLNKFSVATNGGHNHASQTLKNLRDDEQALLLLLQCGNNFDEALRRRRLGGTNINPAKIWSEEECKNFENGLRLYGKSFHEIQVSKVR